MTRLVLLGSVLTFYVIAPVIGAFILIVNAIDKLMKK